MNVRGLFQCDVSDECSFHFPVEYSSAIEYCQFYFDRFNASEPRQSISVFGRLWNPRVFSAFHRSENLVDYLPLSLTFCAEGAKRHETGKYL